jgi:hypothetical protein
MSKRILISLIGATVLCSILGICASAQQLASLNSLAQGTLIANGVDKYKLTGVLVILKENGEARITLYSDVQLFAQGQWSATEDPKVINLKISGGVAEDNPNTRGKLILREDGKTVASLTAQGQGISGTKYEIDFVADEKDPTKP